MSFFKTCALLALATSLAVAKPVESPHRRGTALARRQNFGLGAFGGNDNGNDRGDDRGNDRGNDRGDDNAFDFIGGFNDVNDQEQVIQIQEQNLQIVDNGRQQVVVAQAKEVLIVDQERNGFNRDMNDIFRKTNARRENQDQTVVMLVVQEIQVAIDDGEGNVFQQQVFAQSAVVANRGRDSTKTVMMFAAQTLVAADILGDNNDDNRDFGNGGRQGGRNGNDSVAAPTKTNDVQLLGTKPTWSEVAEDPAATVGDIWAQEVADAKNADNDAADNQANAEAAAAEKAAMDEQAKAAEEAKKQEEQAQAEQAKQQEEQAKQQAEQAKQQEEQAKQQEEAKAQEEAANATAKYI